MKKSYLFILSLWTYFYTAQNLSTGLQACYPLDGNANNYAATGSALNGLLNNVSSTTGHNGTPNTAYHFNGDTASFIKLPGNSLIKPTTEISFSGWFYLDSLPVMQYLVFTKNICSGNFEAYSLITYYIGTKHVFRVSKSDSTCNYAPQVDSQTPLATHTWYQVVFYISNSQIKLYVNGALEGTSTHNIQFNYQAGKDVFLSGTRESYNYPFKGRMDNIRIYDRELTLSDVSQLYNQDISCSPQPVTSFKVLKNSICKGEKIAFIDQSTNSPTSWSWQFQGGTPATSSIANPTITFSSSGIYTVSLTSSNSFGSGDMAVQTITVSDCISIAENETREVPSFYPNPTSGKLFYKNLKGMSFEIYDAMGSKIAFTQTEINEITSELNLLNTQRGLYFVKIYNDKGEHIHASKIVISD